MKDYLTNRIEELLTVRDEAIHQLGIANGRIEECRVALARLAETDEDAGEEAPPAFSLESDDE